MKKLLVVFIILSLLVGLIIAPLSVESKELTNGEYKYKVENNSVEITRYIGKNKEIDIPQKIEGKDVVSLGEYSFSGCKIRKVNLPDSVVYIRKGAFTSSKVEEIIISNSVISIGDFAFEECYNLKKVNFPISLKKLGKNAFSFTKLTSIYLKNNVHKIMDGAFSNIKTLKKISVSKSNKFFCTNKKGVLFNKKKTRLIQYPIGDKNKKYIVPKNVKIISKEAFMKSGYLSRVILNKKLSNIKFQAFYSCNNLKYIKFQSKLKLLGDYAFCDCKKLTKINLPKNLKKIGAFAFENCKKIRSIIIPKSVTDVGDRAFCLTGLKKIRIKENKNLRLGIGVFSCCKIVKVTIPELKHSKGQTFSGCKQLRKITFTKKAKKIYAEDFLYCKKLKTVTIPKNIKKIGNYSLGYNGTYHENYPKIKGFTIKGYKGTAAEKYAKKNKFKFVALG